MAWYDISGSDNFDLSYVILNSKPPDSSVSVAWSGTTAELIVSGGSFYELASDPTAFILLEAKGLLATFIADGTITSLRYTFSANFPGNGNEAFTDEGINAQDEPSGTGVQTFTRVRSAGDMVIAQPFGDEQMAAIGGILFGGAGTFESWSYAYSISVTKVEADAPLEEPSFWQDFRITSETAL